MVYIDTDKISTIKRHHCCKIIPVDERKIENVIAQRRKYIAKDTVKDVRCTIKRETELLSKVKTKLDVKRQEAEIKRINLVNQWIVLKNNEEEFRSLFIEFHQFIVDNREKIGRERAKILLLQQSTAVKEEEIKEMNRKFLHFKNIFDQMKEQMRKHEIYKKFMEHYIFCNEAKSIRDVLLRYELLLETRNSMVQTMTRRRDDIRQYSNKYLSILQNWTGAMLKFGETLTQQTKKYDEAQRQVVYWERTISSIKNRAHSLWLDMELTRESLNHVICLLIIRMKANVEPDFFKKNNTIQYLLTTPEGKILYLNKMLGDLMRVKNEVREIMEEEHVSKVDVATSTQPIPRKRVKLKKRQPPTHHMYPTLSAGTSRIIERLENNIKRAADRAHQRRTVKSEAGSQMSYSSTLESMESWNSRERAMTSWLITKEAKRKGKRWLPNLDPTSTTRGASLSTGSRNSVPLSRRLDYIPRKFSFVTVTSNASTYLIDEKRTKTRDRIIERNFARYEKFVSNKMDTDSSLIKINKETGKLELPKLNFKQKPPIEKASEAVSLPKVDHSFQKKQKKRCLENSSIRTYSSQVASPRSGMKSKKEILLFEDMEKFLSRPPTEQLFSFGNLQ